MFYGEPFLAYDHKNYIDFLNSPQPFLFEPIYYLFGLFVNIFVEGDYRFPVIFVIFTAPPFLLMVRAAFKQQEASKKLMIFASILTKSFFIGFISQRIFFAELIVSATIIYFWQKKMQYVGIVSAGLIHFSGLTILPVLFYLRSRFNLKIVIASFVVVFLLFISYKFRLIFSFFGFDYSRYLDAEITPFSVFTLLQSAVLSMLIYFFNPQKNKKQLIFLAIILGLLKVMFTELEVFSRIFQIVTDVILIFLGFSSIKRPWATFGFCLGFALLQIFIVSRSDETREIHLGAIINAISNVI